jgi:hypothetical protein
MAIVAVPLASASIGTRESFSGETCSLLPATQIAAIVGDAANASKYNCVPSKTVKTPAGTTYAARAGASTISGGGFFTIQVVRYSSATIESRVEQQYKALLEPVTGVGDWAYARIRMSPVVGGTADTGQFAFGAKGYGVLINVRAKLKMTVDQPALKVLAKAIADKL